MQVPYVVQLKIEILRKRITCVSQCYRLLFASFSGPS